MISLSLNDSDYIKGFVPNKDFHETGYIIEAIENLKRQFENEEIEIISLQNYNPHIKKEVPIWYTPDSYHSQYYKPIINNCRYFTSHYIGRFSYKGVDILIEPRFGNKMFNYLVSYATNLFLPIGSSEASFSLSNNSYWLIALIWRAMLNKALTTGQIPREYQTISRNQKHFRGHLAVSKHIHANICDATRFYCTYKKLSMDNTINRTIRATYKRLNIMLGMNKNVISEFEEYDKRLESMGVGCAIDDIAELDKIRYTRINAVYKPLINLCKTILSNKNAQSSSGGSRQDISYFIDIAELWEMYLLKLLQRNLPPEYLVYSPNAHVGDFLLNNNMRELRPDIIIERNNKVVMIIDAKYKNYSELGAISQSGIQRDDLYQMCTYLYHYGKMNDSIIGLFSSPCSQINNNDIHSFSSNNKHRIGLVNLNAENTMEKIHEEENNYISKIKKYLSELTD